ncbi:hypothetical protein [Dialister micraerophilus]|uniref:hypothetical protein n=1 Tax=Dialister micraerophilus TaxID=309120 RepID=UPI0023EF7A8B|nr:hypothetical protein [Dialister micraerophilus]
MKKRKFNLKKQINKWKSSSEAAAKINAKLEIIEENLFKEALKSLGLTRTEHQLGAIRYLQAEQEKIGEEAFVNKMLNVFASYTESNEQ